jgi:hypothetical protein
VRSHGHTYQFKSNAIDSLNIQSIGTPSAPAYTATFTSKANVTDITDPLNPIALGGNKALQVTMTDRGEPGSSDTIAVSLNDPGGGLLFSSNWNGTKSVEQYLGGGNLQVRPAQFLAGTAGPGAPAGTTINAAQVQSLVPAAIERWAEAGAPPSALAALAAESYVVDDLPAGELGWQNGNTIAIDADASGYGWFVDSTPNSDTEFGLASANSPAQGRVDLLTVLMHEMGHVLGSYEDSDDANTVMSQELPVGVRRAPATVTGSGADIGSVSATPVGLPSPMTPIATTTTLVTGSALPLGHSRVIAGTPRHRRVTNQGIYVNGSQNGSALVARASHGRGDAALFDQALELAAKHGAGRGRRRPS